MKGPALTYLCGKSPRLTYEKVKQVCLLVLKSDNILKTCSFEAVLSDKEKAAWQSFEKFSDAFL